MEGFHVLGFHWRGFEPVLEGITAAGELTRIPLDRFDMSVSHHTVCVGTWGDEGHHPCPNNAKVQGGSICQDCASTFISDLDCIFEPRCDGERCGRGFCHQEHAVYLAFHGPIAKVGMTTSRRVGQRLIEQGCDAYSVLARVDGRASARKLEGTLSEKLALRQRIRSLESLFCMTEPVPIEDIRKKYGRALDFAKGIGLEPGPLELLTGYPIELPLARLPRLAPVEGRHSGKVIGIKGKFLVYENGSLKAMNLQELPGRFVRVA